ncbi:MAG: OmpA family protein [Candidatus Omnitrophica bacterium]|nr:OmpA family protein [Candidatus Omnitrophota bacterium]
MKNNFALLKIIAVVIVAVALSGCTIIFQKGRRSDIQKIEDLSRQVDELSEAKRMLEESLRQEISDKQVKLQMMEKGLVITVVGDILFDSGKTKIRTEAYGILDKIAGVLSGGASRFNIGIEGHTDNEPIKYSGWKSNWELSSARALSVLHYLVDDRGISPARVSAIGYGEFQPVSANDSKEGRQLNRRVEIVLMPLLKKNPGPSEPQVSQGKYK